MVEGGQVTDPEKSLGQGPHPDPLAPDYVAPDLSAAPDGWTEAIDSREMGLYRRVLSLSAGLLVTNFDTRPPSPENAWHLYADDLPLRRTLQNLGFEQIDQLDGYLIIYRRVQPAGMAHAFRRARKAVLLGAPRRAYRRAKAIAQDVRRRRRNAVNA